MHLTREHIDTYCLSLLADERSAGTISKYRRDLTAFARWLDGAPSPRSPLPLGKPAC